MRRFRANTLIAFLGIFLAGLAVQPARALFIYDITLGSDDGQVNGSGSLTVARLSGGVADIADLRISGVAFGISYELTPASLVTASFDTRGGELASTSTFLFSDIVFVHLGRSIRSIGFNLAGPDLWQCAALFGGCPADSDSLVVARAAAQNPVPAPPALTGLLAGLVVLGWLRRRGTMAPDGSERKTVRA